MHVTVCYAQWNQANKPIVIILSQKPVSGSNESIGLMFLYHVVTIWNCLQLSHAWELGLYMIWGYKETCRGLYCGGWTTIIKLFHGMFDRIIKIMKWNFIWVRSRRWACLVTWFCYHLIAKAGNKTGAPSWPDPYSSRNTTHKVLGNIIDEYE